MPISAPLIAESVIRSLAIKFEAEEQASSLLSVPGCELLRYKVPRKWQGPPAFEFTLELLSTSETAREQAGPLIRANPGEALVTRAYQAEHPHDLEIPFLPLLTLSLNGSVQSTGAAKRVGSVCEIDQINLTHLGADAMRPGVVKDSRIQAWCIFENEQAVSSGVLIFDRKVDGKVGYIADMYVVPAMRRRGLGRQILQTLLSQAQVQGLSEIALLPSPMAQKTRFYEKAGFIRAGGFRVNYFLPRAFSII